jgi:hypothetical protein
MTAKKDSERENFEHSMIALFKAPKPPKHKPKKRKKKGKD